MNRSENMRAIRSKDMRPELAVRSLVHRLGYRFRLHRKDLPGKPDLVFVSRRKTIFVHGCFWHSHQGCKVAHLPKSNVDYWGPKLEHNQIRDSNNAEALRAEGWEVMVIWECETRDEDSLRKCVEKFLGQPNAGACQPKPASERRIRADSEHVGFDPTEVWRSECRA